MYVCVLYGIHPSDMYDTPCVLLVMIFLVFSSFQFAFAVMMRKT